MSNLQNDIDYIKSLAEDGSKGTPKNGATMFWAGLLYGLASVGQYAVIKGYLPQTNLMQMALWFGASGIFLVVSLVLGIGRYRIRGSVSNRAVNTAWSAVGLGIGAFILSIIIIANATHEFMVVSGIVAPVILILYGMGWWVSALMSGANWLKWISFGCFLGAPAISVFGAKPEGLLAYALCLALFACVPGWILMRAEKA